MKIIKQRHTMKYNVPPNKSKKLCGVKPDGFSQACEIRCDFWSVDIVFLTYEFI